MISEEAVEAALSALFPDRKTVSGFSRAVQEPIVRTILAAAAPHMLADAWDEGEAAGQDNADSNRGYNIEHKYNPYKKGAR